MDIVTSNVGSRWRAEVWDEVVPKMDGPARYPLEEEDYVEMNEWCITSFGYHARTAFHVFDFRKQAHLEWFILRWCND